MGDVTRTLFGGSKSKQKSQSTSSSISESGNTNLPVINQTFGGVANQTGQAGGMLAKLLGLMGGGDQKDAYQTFQSTPGYQFARDEGLRGVQGSFSGQGMFGSGARDKAMLKYGTGLADQTYGQYMDRLFNFGNQGLQAGGLMSDAGRFSTASSTSQSTGRGSSSSQEGMAKFLGAILASDPSVKENVVKIGEYDDGLGIYEYEYNSDNKHWGDGVQTGVMADEVRMFRPWALGPVVGGVQTVDYSKLEGDA